LEGSYLICLEVREISFFLFGFSILCCGVSALFFAMLIESLDIGEGEESNQDMPGVAEYCEMLQTCAGNAWSGGRQQCKNKPLSSYDISILIRHH